MQWSPRNRTGEDDDDDEEDEDGGGGERKCESVDGFGGCKMDEKDEDDEEDDENIVVDAGEYVWLCLSMLACLCRKKVVFKL